MTPSLRIRKIAIGILALLFVCSLGMYLYVKSQTPKSPSEKALYAARMGGDYLVRHQRENGMFEYRYDPVTGSVLTGYNMLRHAGATYALLELYGVTGKDKYRSAAEQAIKYQKGMLGDCPAPHSSSTCVYDGEKAKVGGNALAILALLEYVRTTGTTKYVAEAEALAQWLIDVQTPAGEFTPHVVLRDGTVDDHMSEYYPGEAIYALTRLYEETGEEKWLVAATSAAAWVIDVRDKEKTAADIPHDHWLLYGMRALMIHAPHGRYVSHAQKIVDGIIALQHRENVDPAWIGGYRNPPRSTPAATRSEALAAAYDLFTSVSDQVYADRAFEALSLGAQFHLRMFIDGPRARSYSNPIAALGGFRKSFEEDEVQIDTVQHHISALLGFSRIAADRESIE